MLQKINQLGDFTKSRPTTVFHLALPQKNLFARDRWLDKSWELDCRFSRFCTWPIRARDMDFSRVQRPWLAVRDFGNPNFVAKAVPSPHRRHFQHTLNANHTQHNLKKNGLHCLLLHRLRRGPQGDQDPGVYSLKSTACIALSVPPPASGIRVKLPEQRDAENTRLTTTMPSFLLFSGQVCFQGHQGRHLPRVRHLPRRRRVPHHPLRLREERRA